jgi:hypothetical protein
MLASTIVMLIAAVFPRLNLKETIKADTKKVV